jgi:hypothetical protein
LRRKSPSLPRSRRVEDPLLFKDPNVERNLAKLKVFTVSWDALMDDPETDFTAAS